MVFAGLIITMCLSMLIFTLIEMRSDPKDTNRH